MSKTIRIVGIVIFSLLIIGPATKCRAQNSLTATGKVIDAYTGLALPYAGLRISESNLINIARSDGSFKLKIPQSHNKHSLIISYLGYESETIALTEFRNRAITVKLNPADKAIAQVTVKPGLAESLLEKALEKVSVNYADTAQNQIAYYLETVKENGEYCDYIELILKIYKAPYTNTFKNDQIQALKGRQAQNLKPAKLYDYVYFVDGPYEAVRCDIAKYPKDFISIPRHSLNFLDKRHFKFYYYSLRYQPELGNDVLIIEFRPKSKRAFYKGSLALHRKTLTFLALYYTIEQNKIGESRLMSEDVSDFLNSQNIYTQNLNYECFSEYEFEAGKAQFKYASIRYSYLWKNRSRNTTDTIEYHSEIHIRRTLNKAAEPVRLWKRFMYAADIRNQIPRNAPDSLTKNDIPKPYRSVLREYLQSSTQL
jgi:hypothetical protein